MPARVRIGNGCGFWGDNTDAPVLMARSSEIDYLTLEYLAELTTSILAPPTKGLDFTRYDRGAWFGHAPASSSIRTRDSGALP